jgi:hypothetical protein
MGTASGANRGLMVVAVLLLSLAGRTSVAQTAAAQAGTAKPPDWQTAAGGKREFDVVSIHPTKPGEFTPPNFDMTAGESGMVARRRSVQC